MGNLLQQMQRASLAFKPFLQFSIVYLEEKKKKQKLIFILFIKNIEL